MNHVLVSASIYNYYKNMITDMKVMLDHFMTCLIEELLKALNCERGLVLFHCSLQWIQFLIINNSRISQQ